MPTLSRVRWWSLKRQLEGQVSMTMGYGFVTGRQLTQAAKRLLEGFPGQVAMHPLVVGLCVSNGRDDRKLTWLT